MGFYYVNQSLKSRMVVGLKCNEQLPSSLVIHVHSKKKKKKEAKTYTQIKSKTHVQLKIHPVT